MRRMIAGVVGAVLLLILFFAVKACNNTRHDNALKDYNRQVANIGTASRQTGEQFFKTLGAEGSKDADRALRVDPRLQGRGGDRAQAGPGAQRPRRHDRPPTSRC